MSPNININAVPCGDASHSAVSSITGLEMHIRANCKIPKTGKQVKDGRYWTLQTSHQPNAIDAGMLDAFHQSALDAWKKGLYPKEAGVKLGGNYGVMSMKVSLMFSRDEE